MDEAATLVPATKTGLVLDTLPPPKRSSTSPSIIFQT